jgi:hypothetical protein
LTDNIVETDDIVERLRDWAFIVNESQGVAVVVMLEGSIFTEAADEIESLRVSNGRWRCERSDP